MAGVAVAVATTTPPDATATLQAIQSCRRESAALERLDCYDRLLAPLSPSGFDGALVKAGFVGEAWTRATEQEKRREGNTTELLVTQVPGERPTVVITTPAIGHVPPCPVLMFSCVDNITRMQVALMHPLDVHDIAVTLNADKPVDKSSPLLAKALSDNEKMGNDSNLLIVFYVQIMPDDFVMQLHRF
ncbi:hypothetical protein MC04F15_36640 [Escherichia coli]